jgi:hypothetical protein
MAQRATTKQWLHTDLPLLRRDDLEHALSAAGSFRATIAPDLGNMAAPDGRPLFEKLSTILYAVADGAIRWCGYVERSGWDGQAWSIEAASFGAYPHRVPYEGEYRGVKVDPADVMREMWAHPQSYPDGNLDVQVVGATPIRVGTDSELKLAAAQAKLDAAAAVYKAENAELARLRDVVAASRKTVTARIATRVARGRDRTAAKSALAARKRDLTAAKKTKDPAKIAAAQGAVNDATAAVNAAQAEWATADAAVRRQQATVKAQAADVTAQQKVRDSAIKVRDTAKSATDAAADLVREDGGAYKILWFDNPNCGNEIDKVTTATPFDWVERHYWGTNGDPVHQIEVLYPRAGRFRDDLRFATGENIIKRIQPLDDGDGFANEVIGLGAGEGSGAVRRTIAVRDGRLRSPVVVSDKDVKFKYLMDRRIRVELAIRKNTLTIPSIDVRDHPNAPIGSWALGDDILVSATLPWLKQLRIRHRIVAWTQLTNTTARLTLQRSDSFQYGG